MYNVAMAVTMQDILSSLSREHGFDTQVVHNGSACISVTPHHPRREAIGLTFNTFCDFLFDSKIEFKRRDNDMLIIIPPEEFNSKMEKKVQFFNQATPYIFASRPELESKSPSEIGNWILSAGPWSN